MNGGQPSSYLRIIRFDKVGSTNDYAFALGRAGNKEITVVLAKCQTKGRGRLGRSWVSPNSKGIYVSFLFRPKRTLQEIFLLGIVVALATVKSLKGILPLTIKWPNDIVIGNKKIGGVLVETESFNKIPEFVIVGLGINVNSEFIDLPEKATSIFLQTGNKYPLNDLFKTILKEVIAFYDRFKLNDYKNIIDEVKNYLDTLHRRVLVYTHKDKYEGIAVDIDSYGALLVRDYLGDIVRIDLGEVKNLVYDNNLS
ncbi:MAG: biotin--[acetyl-CoA-carboxylase] ligase [Candidatus Omnitrophica bacterium]|nr:biotin--[acetyl-CoA-carboxylase] ligase [Candidatus Omnitrophota bacterium]MCM8826308.1 biotin--[acetyl-CoA-carboxylase] ligase [Candidatus Omnitrophota bacterium]